MTDPHRQTPAASRPQLLIVDDNAEFGQFVHDVAKECGVEVTLITDSRLFMERFIALRPQTVVMDIQMPGINGMQLAQWLGEYTTEHKLSIRLIIVSGRGEEALRLCGSVAAISGIADVIVLRKPIEFVTLFRVLGK